MFILTLEIRVKQWCHRLFAASIHSFEELVREVFEPFDTYDYQDVYKRINHIRMKHDETLEEFLDRFLHLCYEFPEEDID